MSKKNNISKNFWELPELFEINRLPMAAELMTFDTVANALTFDYNKSPYFMNINGTWDFILLDHPAEDYSDKNGTKSKFQAFGHCRASKTNQFTLTWLCLLKIIRQSFLKKTQLVFTKPLLKFLKTGKIAELYFTSEGRKVFSKFIAMVLLLV